jgi:SagB-type dehydrogenase family enzyme
MDFLEQSKMNEYDVVEYSKRLNIIMNTAYFMGHIIDTTQELSCFEKVSLPVFEHESPLAKNLSQLNSMRKSIRNYKEEGLTFLDTAKLLTLSYSLIQPANTNGGFPPSRNIASGGGLYPIDIYLINRKIEGLKRGVYSYNVHHSTMELLSEFSSQDEFEAMINRAFFSDQKQDMDYKNASAYIILGGVLNRVCFKYLDRGLRFALIDTGAIIHSLYLASAALGIGCCAMGSYVDDLVSELIGYKSSTQTVLGVVLIGKIQ